ncbi:hypothetical protein RHSIM_Rhsim05G0030400 [Rhododendron simsii]|uniref:Uncharacterized protein n=1 Tax=Rhododendron simsii TaxID=118357 RepID=A0A834GZ53_RHOSS|nr:hypothetical protein RHSIM_Rhsim05G0030400 [Rhododendron simsii]
MWTVLVSRLHLIRLAMLELFSNRRCCWDHIDFKKAGLSIVSQASESSTVRGRTPQAVLVASRKSLTQRKGVLDITHEILERLEAHLRAAGQLSRFAEFVSCVMVAVFLYCHCLTLLEAVEFLFSSDIHFWMKNPLDAANSFQNLACTSLLGMPWVVFAFYSISVSKNSCSYPPGYPLQNHSIASALSTLLVAYLFEAIIDILLAWLWNLEDFSTDPFLSAAAVIDPDLPLSFNMYMKKQQTPNSLISTIDWLVLHRTVLVSRLHLIRLAMLNRRIVN